jgi:ABC-type Mn2+/Zn2+ transport system ATPase subunit
MTTLLQLNHLQAGYPDRPLASPLSVQIPVGARLGVIGGNGSGKTTLVKTLLGLLPPYGGHYVWDRGASFGYVPQENQMDPLFPLTVKDLLKMGAIGTSTSKEFEKRFHEVMALFEIEELGGQLIRDLSGGQRQRALLARAMIPHPSVLVMDEPHNSLDYFFREKLWKILREFQNKNSFSWIVIDHDLNRVLNQVDWICLIGPHKTICAPTSEVLQPEILSEAYEEPVHIHREEGRFQIHFL